MINDLSKQLQFNEKESKIFIQNEIYEDLQNSDIKTNHIPFAFSYYYLISWLYRYSKYGHFQLDNKNIKQILGYSPTYPEVDYIIKNRGILDSINYTNTVKDFPISWTYDQYLEFYMLSDLDELSQKYIRENLSRKYTIKFPVKAFHRHTNDDSMKDEYNNGYEDGVFFEFENTHLIPFEIFLFTMSNKEIGCAGFYIWSYLRYKNQLYNCGFDVSLDELATQLKIPKSTMCSYLDKLRKYQMIDCQYNQEFFCLALGKNDRKSNTYITNEFEKFSINPISYKKMDIVKVKNYLTN